MTAAAKCCNLLTLHWKMQVVGPVWQLHRVQCESTLKTANSVHPRESKLCTFTKPLGRSAICSDPGP